MRKRKGRELILWKAFIVLDDISPRQMKNFEYIILTTVQHTRICCSPEQAQRLCLYEMYEMTGKVEMRKGGTYLVLETAKLFDGNNFTMQH